MIKKISIIKISISLVIFIVVISFYLIFLKDSGKYENEIETEISYLEIQTDFGRNKSIKYHLVTKNKLFISKIKKIINKESIYGKYKQKKIYLYLIEINIVYKNGIIAEVILIKNKDEDYYFFTYESKNIHKISYECIKDENNQFQEVVDYIIEHGERVD